MSSFSPPMNSPSTKMTGSVRQPMPCLSRWKRSRMAESPIGIDSKRWGICRDSSASRTRLVSVSPEWKTTTRSEAATDSSCGSSSLTSALLRRLVVHVDVALRERNADAFRVEALLDGLRDVELQAPVVGRIGPGPCHDIDAGVGEFGHDDLRRRVGQHPLVGREHFLDDLLRLVDVVAVTDAEGEVDPPCLVGRVVGDDAARDLAV